MNDLEKKVAEAIDSETYCGDTEAAAKVAVDVVLDEMLNSDVVTDVANLNHEDWKKVSKDVRETVFDTVREILLKASDRLRAET
jgi:hypothetical protein